jgi:hypothetical protein
VVFTPTVTVWLVEPPSPSQVSVKVVAAEMAGLVSDPDAAVAPV